MMNRYAIVQISFGLLQELVTVGWTCNAKCSKGLPVGARLVRSYTDDRLGIGCLVFEHESFEPVKLGDEIPVLDVWHESTK